MRVEQLEKRKSRLKQQVDEVKNYITYKRSFVEEQARATVKNRTQEAHAVASHIVEAFHGVLSLEQTQAMVVEALRPIRFNKGRGYFFATRMDDGVAMLQADRSDFEGKSILHVQDADGNDVVKDMAELVKSQGEGFYSYRWTKPDRFGGNYRKISYVKHFTPFNWFLGTGEYAEDMEREVQEETIRRIEAISCDDDGYIFAGTWQGDSLAGPAKGKNVLEVVDVNGVRVVRELISLAKKGGGYLSYTPPDVHNNRYSLAPKISYVRGVPEWEWYIGTGVSLRSIDQAVATIKGAMLARIKKQVLFIVCLQILLCLLAAFIACGTIRPSMRSFSVFLDFFQNAAKDREAAIDEQGIEYSELRDMALAANRMMLELKEAEDKLLKTEARQTLILSSMPLSLYIANLDGDYDRMWASTHVAGITGFGASRFTGVREFWFSRIHKDDRQKVLRGLDGLAVTGKLSVEYRWQVADGSYRWFHDEAVLVRSPDGVPLEMVGLWMDIEERKRMEKELRRAQKMEAIGTFAGGIAHDFNNLLTVILGFVDIIFDEVEDETDLLKDLEEVSKAGRRAQVLVRQILSFSRMHEEEVVQPLQVSLVVSEVSNMLRCSLPATVDMKVNLDSESWVSADPSQIHHLVVSLCTNAYLAMGNGGLLYIDLTDVDRPEEGGDAGSSRLAGRYVRLQVGEAEQGECQKIESRPAMDESGVGAGIAVAVILEITKKYNGFVAVRNKHGVCAGFSVYLPVLKWEEEEKSMAGRTLGTFNDPEVAVCSMT